MERRPLLGSQNLAKSSHYGSDGETSYNNSSSDDGFQSLDVTTSSRIPRKWFFLPECHPKQWIIKRLPILQWITHYNLEIAISDFIAGITVGLTAIPQGIAYALVAHLPAQYGLYSAFMGCFMYCIFGSVKDITVGPTAIMALLTSEHVNKGPEYVVLMSFLCGIIILILGLLNLGFLIDFISIPVTAGFTSAAAITIASGQIGGLFGIKMVKKSHITGITGTWVDIVNNFGTARISDTVLGITCTVILLLMKVLNGVTWFHPVDESRPATRSQNFWRRLLSPTGRKIVGKIIWLFATARNAVIVVVSAAIAFAYDPVLPKINGGEENRNTTFILTGNIESGLPPFTPPPFSLNDTTTGQVTSFGGMITELGSAIAVIPLFAILENMAIAKAFAGGKPIDANQEMIALGICNLSGSFVRSMPTTGSFSRTAVNFASGVRTPAGGIYTGILVLMSLRFLMEFCAYIPKATLAAVIITAVIFSVEYEIIKPMWKSKKLDLIPGFATFFACLFWALEYGILIGVAVQLIFVLYFVARPTVQVVPKKVQGVPYLLIAPDRDLVFPSVGFVRSVINNAGIELAESRWTVVVDCSRVSAVDFTAAKGFKSMLADFRRRKQPIVFFNPSMSLGQTLRGVGGGHDDFVIVYSEEALHQYILLVSSEPLEQTGSDASFSSYSNPIEIGVKSSSSNNNNNTHRDVSNSN